MNLKTKIERLEKRQNENNITWLENLTDAELEQMTSGKDLVFSQWLETLTDDELLILRDERLGARKLRKKFYEFESQN